MGSQVPFYEPVSADGQSRRIVLLNLPGEPRAESITVGLFYQAELDPLVTVYSHDPRERRPAELCMWWAVLNVPRHVLGQGDLERDFEERSPTFWHDEQLEVNGHATRCRSFRWDGGRIGVATDPALPVAFHS